MDILDYNGHYSPINAVNQIPTPQKMGTSYL